MYVVLCPLVSFKIASYVFEREQGRLDSLLQRVRVCARVPHDIVLNLAHIVGVASKRGVKLLEQV